MIVASTSTFPLDQVAGFEAQSKELSAAGCEKIFREQVSSATVRLQLQSALKFVRNGDVFVVSKLDRLARSGRECAAQSGSPADGTWQRHDQRSPRCRCSAR